MALKRDAAIFKNVQTLHILFFSLMCAMIANVICNVIHRNEPLMTAIMDSNRKLTYINRQE